MRRPAAAGGGWRAMRSPEPIGAAFAACSLFAGFCVVMALIIVPQSQERAVVISGARRHAEQPVVIRERPHLVADLAAATAPPTATPNAARRLGKKLRGRGRGRGRGRWRTVSPPPPPPVPQQLNATHIEQEKPAGRSAAELAAFCTAFETAPPPECRRRLPCDLRAFDPGPRYNRFVVEGRYGREKRWAANNVDPASRHFQNGVEWWVHRALPPAVTDARDLKGARRVFVAAYFSYFWIFASHLAGQAARKTMSGLGRMWRQNPSLFVVAHGHPGSCVRETMSAHRLLVDADMSCAGSPRPIAVPYVVSRPKWLVAAELPKTERSTLLFFRGHLPRSSIDTKNVRRFLMQRLAGQPGVVIEAATALKNASYQPHEQYLQRMLHSTFCLAPRGDTASSRRVYESIAAGCIPVIIADDLALPFAKRVMYDQFSVRIAEKYALKQPMEMLQQLRALPAAKVKMMQSAILEARHHFIWHTDPSRPSAVDQILIDMCDADT